MLRLSRSARRPQRFYALVMWLLSFVFAAMLTGLGSLVIADLPRVETRLELEQFAEPGALALVDRRLVTGRDEIRAASAAVQQAERLAQRETADYAAGKAALDAWLAARTATQADDQNPEVLTRTRAVELLKFEQRAALLTLSEARERLADAEASLQRTRGERSDVLAAARGDYRAALRAQDLKIFAYRLALTLPLLLVAGYLVARKRGSSYWPLYRGFVLFALFAFFVELVPYLPSYGGYIRYIVGIAIALLAGHYIIRAMQRYLARQQDEEARSEIERREAIDYETALKKIGAQTCPGCDRSIEKRDGVPTDFCVHCGIMLQTPCPSCGTRNVSFHHFCLSCGTAMQPTEPGVEPVSEPAPA